MTTYRLATASAPRMDRPRLDEFQQQVVDHPGGPLLVLAGPGTGKTTTLVEAIADRIENRGAAPESVLALTFSRKAAEQLRDRVTARLDRTLSSTLSSTFHSFAYGLVRRYAPAELYEAPLRLLSAPEQDVVLAELLSHAPESVAWPESLRRAVNTRGFAREVHAVLSRAREKGLDGHDLRALGTEHGLPEFVAAGHFLDQYLDVLDFAGAIDYPDLIRRAVGEAERHRDELRAEFRHVFVDEYQDTDPGQVALLQALVGDGGNLTVVGDPHQSIYGFRGAEVRGILEFPTAFPRRDGAPADVVALRTTRRFGAHLLLASQRVARRLSLAGTIAVQAREAFLDPVAAPSEHGDGRVDVLTFDTARAETEHLADLLRRAHLGDGIAWSRMAVLVRSGRTTIPALRRSLGAAGVPVEVASDDTPLVREVAVMPLLDALSAVVNLDNDDPETPGYVDTGRAHSLLLSPLAGLDASDVRALARALRVREKERAAAHGTGARDSAELLRAAVLDPEFCDGITTPAAGRVTGLARLLRAAREGLEGGASAEEVLWELWAGTAWPQRLRGQVDAGGGAARRAHRDLDAICALFEAAAKAEEQRGHTGVGTFLETLRAQDIPGDTLADRGVRGEAVRLLTAHRSKGLEWDLVVVAHVQEEAWPDLRRRATLLQADRIGSEGIVAPLGLREQLMEERRLFYVACTRARARLVVTAVKSPEDDGEQPSRFLDELGVRLRHVQGRPRRPLSLAGLVADLRRTVADPNGSEALRAAAARRLRRLAAERIGDRPLVVQADPGTWWGTRAASAADEPVRPAEQPVRLSASALTSIEECPARWFLEREAGGATVSSAAQGFGLLLHALAERVARGELATGPGAADELMHHVDEVWDRLSFRTPWSGAREREELRLALVRFLNWHQQGERDLLGIEQELTARVSLPDGQEVTLHGFADRIEVDSEGRVVVVDLKTGKYPPTRAEVAVHPQLGLYQLAVENGAVDDLVDQPPARPGGAELVQLRHGAHGKVSVQSQPPLGPGEPTGEEGEPGPRTVEEQLMRAVTLIRAEEFPARAGKHCDRCAFQAICPVQGSGTVLS
ncbi:ATP-dependent DNA helicase [Nocardioides sp. AE5]|uniref:ATP-dependent helicase n=1 Tax=Nocardioides sp. AE5 TaxID=2962573 RepID=UPI0028828E44|nr:ATP-dependent DNA helicase [Nocardioides sp. AE5]MDT0203951.1 ATP-dependent DNA helicase [Nocardioides sp. AE5]